MIKINLKPLKIKSPKEKLFLDNDLIIKRDFRLLQQFIPIQLCGFTVFFDKKTRRYISMLVRLIDKATLNYNLIIEHTIKLKNGENIEFGDFLSLTDYAEDCIIALSRAIKIIEAVVSDNSTNLKDFIDSNILEKVKNNKNVVNVRNRMEHISEDIKNEDTKDTENHIINLDESNKLSIGKDGTNIELAELKSVIQDYNNLVLSVFGELPNKHTGDDDVYYKDGEIYTRKRFN